MRALAGESGTEQMPSAPVRCNQEKIKTESHLRICSRTQRVADGRRIQRITAASNYHLIFLLLNSSLHDSNFIIYTEGIH